MKRALILLFLFISANCWSQNDSIVKNTLCIKISPLAFIGAFVGPSLRVSLEYKFKDNHALETEFGAFFISSKGYIAKLELKQYLEYSQSNNSARGNYISCEFFFKNQSYSTSDSFGIDLKEYHVTKSVECFTLKYGGQITLKCGFVFESFVGLGIRFQQNKNTLSFTENAYMEPTTDYGPNIILNKERNSIYPNLVAGVKVGFRILK